MYDDPSSKESFLYYLKRCPPLAFEQAVDSFPCERVRLLVQIVKLHGSDGVEEVHGKVTTVCALSKPYLCLKSCTTISG